MMGLKFNHISKRGQWWISYTGQYLNDCYSQLYAEYEAGLVIIIVEIVNTSNAGPVYTASNIRRTESPNLNVFRLVV